MLEDYEQDVFRSGKGIYFDYRHYVEMEKNNPHGLGDYPRRMIVVEDLKEVNGSGEKEKREQSVNNYSK